MARPRNGSEKHRPKHLGLRVATWIYNEVHRLAVENEQPASDIAHELLEIALGHLGITDRSNRPNTAMAHPSRKPDGLSSEDRQPI
jgi:hypothetical protein